MAAANAREALNNLYSLLMEINFYRTDEDVLADLNENPDPLISKHLTRIKQLNAKFRAETNRLSFQRVTEEFQKIKEKGIEEFEKLFPAHEQEVIYSLFRKLEELTPGDEAAILEDQEMLRLMEVLKDKLDEDSSK